VASEGNEADFRAGFSDARAQRPIRTWARTNRYLDGYSDGESTWHIDADAALFARSLRQP
jgi:hypothetical protein